ncbi:oxidoreductase-like protein [Xylogone sp. PMI_703]|nr:oxidoreductase-like protein [Xylogone sp. PMI_703]
MYSLSKLSIFSFFTGTFSVLLFAMNYDQPESSFHQNSHSCAPREYITRVLSWDPLIMHLENFITAEERQHLLQLPNSIYQRSQVRQKNGTRAISKGQTSSSAILAANDSVVRCIQEQAAKFQGFDSSSIISIQATRYEEGQHFHAHYDWYNSLFTGLVQPVTTFFAILEANCVSCGTEFPLLKYNWMKEDQKICEYVDCEKESMMIKPRAGSAVFWRNVHSDGAGHEMTLHAGLPATCKGGTKVGLNIWTSPNVE